MSIEPQTHVPTCFRRSIIRPREAERGMNKSPFSGHFRLARTTEQHFPAILGTVYAIGESTNRESGASALFRHCESGRIESVKARSDAGEKSPKARMKPLISLPECPSSHVKRALQPPGFGQRFVLSPIQRGVLVYSRRPHGQSVGQRSTADSCFRRSEWRS
jgi:hypothetical protein